MFNPKNKIDYNLRMALEVDNFKKYRVLVKCKNLFTTILKKISTYKDALIYPIKSCNLIACNLTKKEITYISEYPEVSNIFFDEYLFLCGMSVSNANNYHKTSSHFKFSGKDISIASIDSGVYPHPDLKRPSNKIIAFYDLIGNFEFPYDDNGHGTALAGIICGNGDSSNFMYTGIAPNSSLVVYKAFDALGKGYASSILWAISDAIDNSIKLNIKVLSLPFELLSNNFNILKEFQNIFDIAVSKNIIPVVPSGSILASSNTMQGIATLKNCLTIGGISTIKAAKPYKYSSAGSHKLKKPDFACACENITTLNSDVYYVSEKNGVKIYPSPLDAKYKTYSGTSLSVAFVTAICALLFEYDKNLTFNDVYSIINLASYTKKDFSKQNIGNGIINLNNLLK